MRGIERHTGLVRNSFPDVGVKFYRLDERRCGVDRFHDFTHDPCPYDAHLEVRSLYQVDLLLEITTRTAPVSNEEAFVFHILLTCDQEHVHSGCSSPGKSPDTYETG